MRNFKSLKGLLSLTGAMLLSLAWVPVHSEAPGAASVSLGAQQGASQVELAPDHPDQYVVVRGDTLWDIAGMFLRDPWVWPEIWYVNPQIENPHLIYPGDIISLVWVDGRPQLRLSRGATGATERLSPQVISSPLEEAILTVPYQAIAGFLSKPRVISDKDAKHAPYILATRHGNLIAGAHNEVYVRGLDPRVGDMYNVISVGEPLRDPDDGDIIGYEGIFVGEGEIVRNGDPATMLLTSTEREVLEGNRLFRELEKPPLYFMPRAPEKPVQGQIISVIDGTSLIGQYMIVVLNRGTRHGLEPGHVLSVYQSGRVVRDRYAGGGKAFAESVELPEEFAGSLMVFRSEERISYGLVVDAKAAIRMHDVVRSPN